MIVSAIAIVLVGIFAVSLRFTGLRAVPRRVQSTVELAVTTMRDARATDRDKELAARAAALDLLRVALRVSASIVLASLPAAVLMALIHLVGLADYREIVESFTTWPVLVVGAITATIAMIIK